MRSSSWCKTAAWLAMAGTLFFAGLATAAPYQPGVILVKLKARLGPDRSLPARLRAEMPAGAGAARAIHGRPAAAPSPGGVDRIYEIPVPGGTDVETLAAKLSRLSDVEYAEPRYLYPLLEEAPQGVQAVPNDPHYATDQAYLPLIQVEAAWDVIKGETSSPLVCVVDGGTQWTHEDLQANIWTNPGEIPGNGLDDDGNGFVDDIHGWDFLANDGDPRGSPLTPGSADHGTHTGGLLAAVTNNAIGMASASWNPRLMAVNASASTDLYIAYGYEGILYAVDNGASIVSLSWGGPQWSQLGKDVVEYATAHGVLLFAAAGNEGNQIPFYPAAYPNVYGVVNTQHIPPATDLKRFSSNYGTWVDLCAPGTDIFSTLDMGASGTYGLESGTSMATPIAAAVAALVKSQHPAWSGLEVGEQVRVTCDDIDGLNPSYAYLLGKGRVNATRAVTESPPAVRVTGWSFADANGNGQLERGETVTMSLDLHDYREAAQGLGLTLVSASGSVTVMDGTEFVGDLAGGADASLPAAFSFTIATDAPLGTQVDLRIGMSATGYSDFQWISVQIDKLYETHDVNRLRASLTATGSVGWIGFPGEPGGWKGEGVRFEGGSNCLFEGGLMLGTDASHVSDAIRQPSEHQDFAPFDQIAPILRTPGLVSDQETEMPFVDVGSPPPLGVRVSAESRAFAAPPNDAFLFLGYRVTNTSGAPFTGLRAGLFFDWDIDENHAGTNRADWDAGRGLGYAWDTTDPDLPYFGVIVLQGGPQTIYAAFSPSSTTFSDAVKWSVMTGGYPTSTGPGDVCHALSTGPFDVPAGDSMAVWFALVAGQDLTELQANADQARQLWSSIVAVGPAPVGRPTALELGAARPNPTRSGTRLELRVDRLRRISAAVYDANGRRVRTLANRDFESGVTSLVWDGGDEHGRPARPGIYFVELLSGSERLTRKVVRLR